MNVRLNTAICDIGSRMGPPTMDDVTPPRGAGQTARKSGGGDSGVWAWFKEKIKWVKANDAQRAQITKHRHQQRADSHAGKVLVAMLDCRERPASTARIKNRLDRLQKHADSHKTPIANTSVQQCVERKVRDLRMKSLTTLRDGFFGDENIIPRADVQKKYKAGPNRELAKQGMQTVAAAIHNEFARRTITDSIRGLAELGKQPIHDGTPADLQPHLLMIGARIEELKRSNPVQGAKPEPEQFFLRPAITNMNGADLGRLRYVLFGAPLPLAELGKGISPENLVEQAQVVAGMAAIHDGMKVLVRDEIMSRISAKADAEVAGLDNALQRMFDNLKKPAALTKFDVATAKLPKKERNSARQLAQMAIQFNGAFEMHLASTRTVSVANLPPLPELTRRSTGDLNRYNDAVHREREAIRNVFREFDKSITDTAGALGVDLSAGLPQELLLTALRKTDFMQKNPGVLSTTLDDLDNRRYTSMPSLSDGDTRVAPMGMAAKRRFNSLPNLHKTAGESSPIDSGIYQQPLSASEPNLTTAITDAVRAETVDKSSHRREDLHIYSEIKTA